LLQAMATQGRTLQSIGLLGETYSDETSPNTFPVAPPMPLAFDAPLGGPRRNIVIPFVLGKLEWCGYPTVKTF